MQGRSDFLGAMWGVQPRTADEYRIYMIQQQAAAQRMGVGTAHALRASGGSVAVNWDASVDVISTQYSADPGSAYASAWMEDGGDAANVVSQGPSTLRLRSTGWVLSRAARFSCKHAM